MAYAETLAEDEWNYDKTFPDPETGVPERGHNIPKFAFVITCLFVGATIYEDHR